MVGFKEVTAVKNKLMAWHAEVIIADIAGSEVNFKTCNLHWRQAQLLLHTRATTTSLLKHTDTQCLAINGHEESIFTQTRVTMPAPVTRSNLRSAASTHSPRTYFRQSSGHWLFLGMNHSTGLLITSFPHAASWTSQLSTDSLSFLQSDTSYL